MTDEPENLMLEFHRRTDRKGDHVAGGGRDTKNRMTAVDTGSAGVDRRIDRVGEGLDRTERHPERADAHPGQ